LEASFSFFLPGPKWSTLSRPKDSTGQAKCGRSMAQKKQSKARDYTQPKSSTFSLKAELRKLAFKEYFIKATQFLYRIKE